jgi:hypothetical protein
MPPETRSQYEYGDPTMDAIAAEERADHRQAAARGRELGAKSIALVNGLVGEGQLRGDPADARITLFHLLAALEYPNQAVDIPELRHLDERTTP